MKYFKTAAFLFLAFLIGIVGLSLVFSDMGSGESWGVRTLIATAFFFFSGVLIGFFNPKLWMISGVTAWGGVLMGGFLTLMAFRKHGADAFNAQEPPYIFVGVMMLILPITLALMGGFLGKILTRFRAASSTQLT